MFFRYVGVIGLAASTIFIAAAAPFPSTPPLNALVPAEAGLPPVVTHDNRRAAGVMTAGALALDLRVGVGLWRPEGAAGPSLRIEAFGEGSAPLSAPGPLIRAPQGTVIDARVRNDLATSIRVHGFCERGGAVCAPLDVPGGEARRVRFTTGPAGTYHYWATSTDMPLQFRASGDTQLSGAFIVDGADTAADRVFVITDWTDLTREQLRDVARALDPGVAFLSLNPKVTFLVNGLSWPHTERLAYRVAEPVRWRVLNLSTQTHPMHMHGFYFTVDSLGNGWRDARVNRQDAHRVVTQVLQPGETMAMTWTPERVGNWLFHCHVKAHVSPELRLGAATSTDHHAAHDQSAGMAGLVMGITVTGPASEKDVAQERQDRQPRRMTLDLRTEPRRFGDAPAYGFVLAEDDEASSGRVPVPGPTLVLKRDEPVEITLVNHLPEATAIHWHGMELESYYDGVHGWSGDGQRVTPMIEPGATFVVRFTPPRTGTFMYHTHLHDNRQLTSGLYGAMLVVDPDEVFDEARDHVVVLGRGGPQPEAPVVINGSERVQTEWKAGIRHRVRLINITPDDILSVALQTQDGPVAWTPVTKDGAPLPAARCQSQPAKVLIGVGETYDFEVDAPPGRRTLWLEVRSPGGKWLAQAQVIVR